MAQPKTHDTFPPSQDHSTSPLPDVEKQIEASHDDNPMTVRPVHGLSWVLAVGSLYSFALLYGLDTTITADIQPAIIERLGHIQKLAWIGVGFPLGSVATILPIGFAYGLFDLKKFIVLSIITFEAGSAVCGAAPTMDVLIVGRVIAGIGGAGMYIGALNFVGVFTTRRERSLYTALMGIVWGLGTVLGPVVGGLFADRANNWRWAFYINLVLAAIFGPILLYLLPTHQPQKGQSFITKLVSMDWLGIALIAGVLTTYVVALTFGGALWPWQDYRFITTITFCGVLLVVFTITQYFSVLTKQPIFPGQFLRSRTMILLYIATAGGATALVVGAYFIPLYFQFVHQDSALKAAVRLLPFILTFIFAVMFNGAILPIVGYYSPSYLASGILMTIGGALMHTVDVDTSPAKIYGFSILFGLGAGFSSQSGYAISQAIVPPRQLSDAVSFMNLAQIGTIVLALTIAGSVFQNTAITKLIKSLSGYGFTVDEIKTAVAGTQSPIFQHGSPEVRLLALKAIVGAMDNVFILIAVGGAVVIVAALLMKREKVDLPRASF